MGENPLLENNNGCGRVLRRAQFPLEGDELFAGGGAGALVGGVGAPPPCGTWSVTPASDGKTQKLMLPDSIARRST
jgi:hypothetical protein